MRAPYRPQISFDSELRFGKRRRYPSCVPRRYPTRFHPPEPLHSRVSGGVFLLTRYYVDLGEQENDWSLQAGKVKSRRGRYGASARFSRCPLALQRVYGDSVNSKPRQGTRLMVRPAPPKPVGRQREVLYLPATGHTVVLGTAGSGKTTLAILRSIYLADPSTDHHGRTLLVTFNRCLVAYMKHLATDTLLPITVENYHRFARGYLTSLDKLPSNCISTPDVRQENIRLARRDALINDSGHRILHRPVAFFDEEFDWIQKHGIKSKEEYLSAERVGRTTTRVTTADRPAVFDLYSQYLDCRKRRGKLYDWSDLASAVRSELDVDQRQRLYRHIVVDEGQDFSPEMLRSLAAAIPSSGSLTFFGDIAQQIYGHRMSWRNAGLRATRIWHFSENYRNTKQISKLALALAGMPAFPDDPDLVEPTAPIADGPLPALVRHQSEFAERDFAVSAAKQASETGTTAILLRTRGLEDVFRDHIPPSATRLHRRLKQWPTGPGLFYGTYHAAKGLEFDTVFLPFLSDTKWPHLSDVNLLGKREAEVRNSRLLYVGITRARSTLVLSFSGRMTSLLPTDRSLYQS